MPLARSALVTCLFWTVVTTSGVLAESPSDVKKPAYRVLGADRGHVAIVDARGAVQWEVPVRGTPHDLSMLAGGNLLFPANETTLVEMTPAKTIVWQYESKPKPGYDGPVEVHAFQRLADGRTMIAETGNRRIIEVDRDGKIVHEVPLTVDRPHPHRDTRMARKLENGNYLVCH
jgi:hypothetical protein